MNSKSDWSMCVWEVSLKVNPDDVYDLDRPDFETCYYCCDPDYPIQNAMGWFGYGGTLEDIARFRGSGVFTLFPSGDMTEDDFVLECILSSSGPSKHVWAWYALIADIRELDDDDDILEHLNAFKNSFLMEPESNQKEILKFVRRERNKIFLQTFKRFLKEAR